MAKKKVSKKKELNIKTVIVAVVVILVILFVLAMVFQKPVDEEEGLAAGKGGASGKATGSLCKDANKPTPCFTGSSSYICCPEGKPYCTATAGSDNARCKGQDRHASCVKEGGTGIQCGTECCIGICLSVPIGFRGSYDFCCTTGTYPVKNEEGVYVCKKYCKPGEEYDLIDKECKKIRERKTCTTKITRRPGELCGVQDPIYGGELCCAVEDTVCGTGDDSGTCVYFVIA